MDTSAKRNDATEPWMRGTHQELDPLRRGVIHALELAEEDVVRYCGGLTDQAIFAHADSVAPLAFHLRHIARSLDRLLTYAENRQLNEVQLAALKTETDPGTAAEVMTEFRNGIQSAKQRIRRFDPRSYADARGVGRKRLPTTVGGLLIHCAEHTSRHVGQAVTTAKFLADSMHRPSRS